MRDVGANSEMVERKKLPGKNQSGQKKAVLTERSWKGFVGKKWLHLLSSRLQNPVPFTY